MADATQFGHDQLAHILDDYLLEVPRFQRAYSWDESNVAEFLNDLAAARRRDADYFMGTIVLSSTDGRGQRKLVVDGQQRLATAAILLVAIRDELARIGKHRQALESEKRYLRGYVLEEEEEVERLILNAQDMPIYLEILGGTMSDDSKHPLVVAYRACLAHLQCIPAAKLDQELLLIMKQLSDKVQVLKAEASDLPEAYVIFETLNDRGADLTTADLLKNYLFSVSGAYFSTVERIWINVESSFEKAEDLVKFIRYDYVSRSSTVSARRLYRAIQDEIDGKARAALRYLERLGRAEKVYHAVRNPEDTFWAGLRKADVTDTLSAYRRFGFEASFPVILAAFETWTKDDAARLLIKLGNWSIRAQVAGRLGGGTAEDSFNETAMSVSAGESKNQLDVRRKLSRILPDDDEFRASMREARNVQSARAKYFLAMLESAHAIRSGLAPPVLDWSSRGVTIEHIMPLAGASSPVDQTWVGSLGNLTLLEKSLNHQIGSKSFADRTGVYRQSGYALTALLHRRRVWNVASVRRRGADLADLGPLAWPDH